MINAFRRSVYLILSGLMGLLVFFILHRIAVFVYLSLVTSQDIVFEYNNFLIWDYITLSAALIVGLVYGMWVGEYWYKVVYHENVHNGLVDYIASFFYSSRQSKPEAFQHKLENVALKLENNLAELENLTSNTSKFLKSKTPIKRLKTKTPLKNSSVKKTSVRTRKKI